MKKSLQKALAITIITFLLITQSMLMRPVLADEPTPPAVPTAPPAPTAPPEPTPPGSTTPTPEPTAPSAYTTPTPTATPTPRPTRSPTPTPTPTTAASTVTTTTTPSPTPSTSGNQTGGQNDGGNVGSTTITTGDATNNAGVGTLANTNTSSGTSIGDPSTSGTSVVNAQNGDGSQNNGSVVNNDSASTIQNNTANVTNTLTQQTLTGKNTSNSNTGGDTAIETGNANTSGTVLTAVNTNVDGVAVAEFNVNDNQHGDLVLDFASNCISGCANLGPTSVSNTNNGADSTNTASTVNDNSTATFQNNDATIGSNLVLASNSGDNSTSRNTAGNSTITTGNANTSGNVLTLANNNVQGNIVYGVVNIYGELHGDIVMPEEAVSSCCNANGSTHVGNTKNGDGSTNTASVNNSQTNSTTQNNLADITNNVDLQVTSGDNDASRNTDGNASVTTGNTSAQANVVNVANSNIVGNVWLVLVNQAGKWVGKILGSPDGSQAAASEGMEVTVGANGEILATNAGNGDNSTNTTSVDQNSTTSTTQNNNAAIVNNVSLSANTGGNLASRNTGGSSTVDSGDAKVIANIVNFVNNNIVGHGKLFVTVVNVFGTWVGDFVTPGQKQEHAASQSNTQTSTTTSTQQSTGGANVSGLVPTPTVHHVSQVSDPQDSDDAVTGSSVTTRISKVKKTLLSTNTSYGRALGAWTQQTQGSYTTLSSGSENQIDGAAVVAGYQKIKIKVGWLILALAFAILYFARNRLKKLYSTITAFLF